MSSTRAVFVGDGSLLIQCAEAYCSAGHKLLTVASHTEAILAWAAKRNITAIRLEADASLDLAELEFDYLFSIAYLHVLPASVIARPLKLAINFHDALLPRYAGLNAPAWALMAQEMAHGITWHEMTPAVDAGRIVRQTRLEIAPGETALSLNTKCYEAGLASFLSILEDLGRGDLPLTEQRGTRTYFGARQRPALLATLDFSRPAQELEALVRALDFGAYPNLLACPKLYLGDKVLYVRSAHAMQASSKAAPGTVLEVRDDALRVATGEGDLLLGGIHGASPALAGDAAGPALACEATKPALARELTEGAVLPALSDALQGRLAKCIPAAAQGEPFWRKAFASLAALELPYPRKVSQPASGAFQPVRLPLHIPACGGQSVAGFFSWLTALTGQQTVSVIYGDDVLATQADGVEPWLCPWVPLTLTINPQASVRQAQELAKEQIESIHQAGSCPRDLPLRLGAPQAASVRPLRMGVSMRRSATPCQADLLLTVDAAGDKLELVADSAVFSSETLRVMAAHLAAYLAAWLDTPASASIAAIALVPAAEAQLLASLNATAAPYDDALCVHQAVSAQAARTPDHAALICQGSSASYHALEEAATALARRLMAKGVRPGDTVGICLAREPELVVSVLAILKTGAAYLPLDPAYPQERILYMIEDSSAATVITTSAIAAALDIPVGKTFLMDGPAPPSPPAEAPDLQQVSADNAAYVIYTSGSTGRPKGVVVTHGNVMNFFAGMDQRIPAEPPGRWLAVTSLSFDISVLELCWTLTRGFTVVLHSATARARSKPVDFSLFYFASDSASPQDRYKLLLEGAKFADQAGFSAIWTPERHFHAFGGLYPNPALTSAVLAAITTRVKIRAGSCVLPLHHPIRAAEDWAFVDNISQGRVGVSFAAGWQPNDFVIAPGAFADRKNEMLASIATVRRLWRGESVAFDGPLGKPVEIQTLPRPIQPELPVWLTAAGNPETFELAGEKGCNLLTHLLGQSTEEVAEKIRLYRLAWQKAGHPGQGHVTLMLHTFIGDDEEAVRETVREPMKAYLRSSVDLIRQAAWSFPTFVQRGTQTGKSPVEIMDSQPLSAEEMDALLEHAFARYYDASALFGTPQRCLSLVHKFKEAGVDEIACLIDFGIDTHTVLAHLQHLKALMQAGQLPQAAVQPISIADEIVQSRITHLQCTPSMAAMLVADAAGRAALARLDVLMVGGEALPLPLARELRALVPGKLLNMYGPTETTIWSSTCDLAQIKDFIPLGEPIANTRLHIRTPGGLECPALVAGELLIGGDGVTRGYWQRPELTAERFIADPSVPGERLYRTGDLVRRHPGGQLEFLGRIDHQVKLRGHRIELGEIESALLRQKEVKEAVVIVHEDAMGDKRLVGYITSRTGAAPDTEKIRQALQRDLPAIMVPAALLVLQALPLTPNNKVDRRALPQPRAAAAVPFAAAPESQLEKRIAAIWQDALGLPSVGMTDNFFDLGGHSLLVVQVQRRLHEACGQEVSITDMFRFPTIRALAAHLDGQGASTALDEGLQRAQARRAMRSRTSPASPSSKSATPAA
jgi:natural product biosynthesis luciferase-like monooxygenase protein